jgi:hypothetical protein
VLESPDVIDGYDTDHPPGVLAADDRQYAVAASNVAFTH